MILVSACLMGLNTMARFQVEKNADKVDTWCN